MDIENYSFNSLPATPFVACSFLSFLSHFFFFFFFAGLEGWFLRVDLTFLSFVPAPCIKSYKGICREYWKIWRGVGRDEKLAERIQCECFNSGTCKLDFRIGFSDFV